jgi:hypothetical protein
LHTINCFNKPIPSTYTFYTNFSNRGNKHTDWYFLMRICGSQITHCRLSWSSWLLKPEQ